MLKVRFQHLFDAAAQQFPFAGAADRAAFGEDFVFDEGDQQFFFGAADPAEDVVGPLAVEGVVVGVLGQLRRVLAAGEVDPEFGRVGGVDRAFGGEQEKRRGDPVGGVLFASQHRQFEVVDQRVTELVGEDEAVDGADRFAHSYSLSFGFDWATTPSTVAANSYGSVIELSSGL